MASKQPIDNETLRSRSRNSALQQARGALFLTLGSRPQTIEEVETQCLNDWRINLRQFAYGAGFSSLKEFLHSSHFSGFVEFVDENKVKAGPLLSSTSEVETVAESDRRREVDVYSRYSGQTSANGDGPSLTFGTAKSTFPDADILTRTSEELLDSSRTNENRESALNYNDPYDYSSEVIHTPSRYEVRREQPSRRYDSDYQDSSSLRTLLDGIRITPRSEAGRRYPERFNYQDFISNELVRRSVPASGEHRRGARGGPSRERHQVSDDWERLSRFSDDYDSPFGYSSCRNTHERRHDYSDDPTRPSRIHDETDPPSQIPPSQFQQLKDEIKELRKEVAHLKRKLESQDHRSSNPAPRSNDEAGPKGSQDD